MFTELSCSLSAYCIGDRGERDFTPFRGTAVGMRSSDNCTGSNAAACQTTFATCHNCTTSPQITAGSGRRQPGGREVPLPGHRLLAAPYQTAPHSPLLPKSTRECPSLATGSINVPIPLRTRGDKSSRPPSVVLGEHASFMPGISSSEQFEGRPV